MALTLRNGQALKVLQDGHPRRLADGRNAWKKMDQAQRETFLRDVVLTEPASIDLALKVIDEYPRTRLYRNGNEVAQAPLKRAVIRMVGEAYSDCNNQKSVVARAQSRLCSCQCIQHYLRSNWL